MPWFKTVAIHCRAMTRLAVCNSCDVSALGPTVKGFLALYCYQPLPEVII